MSETSGVIMMPSPHCSRSKVYKSLINKAKISGLLTSPCIVPTLQGKVLVSPQPVRTLALKVEYVALSIHKYIFHEFLFVAN